MILMKHTHSLSLWKKYSFQTKEGFWRQNLFPFTSGFYPGLELTYSELRGIK